MASKWRQHSASTFGSNTPTSANSHSSPSHARKRTSWATLSPGPIRACVLTTCPRFAHTTCLNSSSCGPHTCDPLAATSPTPSPAPMATRSRTQRPSKCFAGRSQPREHRLQGQAHPGHGQTPSRFRLQEVLDQEPDCQCDPHPGHTRVLR